MKKQENLDILNRNNLSKSEHKIVDYIEKNPNKIEALTINQLALEVNTSVATVLRFCQKLGYSGFKEFKFAFAKELSQPAKGAYSQALGETISLLPNDSQKKIDIFTNALTNKNINLILGVYYSGIPAQFLTNGLVDLGYKSICATSTTTGEHILNIADAESTIVVFSINGLFEKYKNYWRTLIDEPQKNTFLITLNKETKLRKYFSHTIVLPGQELAHKSAFDPQSIPVAFVESVLNKIYQNR